MEGDYHGDIDLYTKAVTFLESEVSSGGLSVPGKDKVVFRNPERKALLGLDAKRELKGVFRVPKDKAISSVSSVDEDEKSMFSEVDDLETDVLHVRPSKRCYRGYSAVDSSRSESGLTSEGRSRATEVCSPSGRSYPSARSHTPSKYGRVTVNEEITWMILGQRVEVSGKDMMLEKRMIETVIRGTLKTLGENKVNMNILLEGCMEDLTGMMEDGNGKTPHAGIIILHLVGATGLHQPQC
ncbi:hypothetical protein MKW98_029737 [Papaver atlanticum]|uniref:Uncharacterized protein n=1 Tax=Papaver atlanticum TaxID=357466 RepID=A0AAD4T6Q7_9MAGN|nr:hypothetical protein MKW98_029737 [Papaver atlanticum]